MTHPFPLPPGSVIGIFGSGQLGRMLSMAASRLGFQAHIFAPTGAISPAAQVSHFFTQGAYEDLDAVKNFAAQCDVLTYEFENVPAATAAAASSLKPLRPSETCLDIAQDRLTEKTFISEQAGVPVVPFEKIDSLADLHHAFDKLGGACVLKTRRFGYDGKGQVIIRELEEIESAWEKLGGHACIAEGLIQFEREISIICARGITGETACYPLSENDHRQHILHKTIAPSPTKNEHAKDLALKIMTALDYVGVMATEFFELKDGSLLVNEIAPRVHNSGHWTQDAGCIDQFENHIRAITGWPLGSASPKYQMEMTNLIGFDANDWQNLSAEAGTFIHFYGKAEAREGRKMGHVNRIIKKL
jgi:5-(carboxyamino)imidazole ribonucleotide synthase